MARSRDALTARAGSGARTAEPARRANATDGASYRIAREVERPRQEAEARLPGGRRNHLCHRTPARPKPGATNCRQKMAAFGEKNRSIRNCRCRCFASPARCSVYRRQCGFRRVQSSRTRLHHRLFARASARYSRHEPLRTTVGKCHSQSWPRHHRHTSGPDRNYRSRRGLVQTKICHGIAWSRAPIGKRQ